MAISQESVLMVEMAFHPGGGGGLCALLPGAGDDLPPQRGEISIYAGGGEGFSLGAAGFSLELQLGDLEQTGAKTSL